MVFINPVIKVTVMINHSTLQTLDGLPCLCRETSGYLLGLLGEADAQERLGLFPFLLSERAWRTRRSHGCSQAKRMISCVAVGIFHLWCPSHLEHGSSLWTPLFSCKLTNADACLTILELASCQKYPVLKKYSVTQVPFLQVPTDRSPQ